MAFLGNAIANSAIQIAHSSFSLHGLHTLAWIAVILVLVYIMSRPSRVYLVDFICYKAPDDHRVPTSSFIEHYELSGKYTTSSIDFVKKLCQRTGIGNEAYMPLEMGMIPPDLSLNSCVREVQNVVCTMAENVLSKNNIDPKTIDILVVNSGMFCPTPSVTSMVINKFGLRSDIRSFNLSGMGCSAGLLSVSLVKDLLKVHKNSLALILTLESILPNSYHGQVKSMLIANTLFRTGGAAILLSNRRQDKSRAKYVLRHLVRTNMSFDDRSYYTVHQDNDEEGFLGTSLSKDTVNVAGNALRTNIKTLGPIVLPYLEQLRYVWYMIHRKIRPSSGDSSVYVPNFKKAFEHICIHAGGRAVVDAVQRNLGLSKEDAEPARMTLYRFGNTASTSVWYSLAYMEAKGRVKKADRIWQIAFGAGFKCNSAVWKCVSAPDPNTTNAWSDRIQLYPVDVPETLDL